MESIEQARQALGLLESLGQANGLTYADGLHDGLLVANGGEVELTFTVRPAE